MITVSNQGSIDKSVVSPSEGGLTTENYIIYILLSAKRASTAYYNTIYLNYKKANPVHLLN